MVIFSLKRDYILSRVLSFFNLFCVLGKVDFWGLFWLNVGWVWAVNQEKWICSFREKGMLCSFQFSRLATSKLHQK